LVRIDKKIGARQKKEMQHLVADMREDLGKLAQQASGWWNDYPETPVNGLVCGKMVLPGANSADACDNPRDFFGCAALDKFFEPAHRHNMHAGLSYIAALVQRDTYPGVTFDSGHRLYRYLSYGTAPGFRNCFAHKDPFPLPDAAKSDPHRRFFNQALAKRQFSLPCAPENRSDESLSGRFFVSIPLLASAFRISIS